MSRALGDGWLLPALDDANRAWFTSGRLGFQRCTGCGRLQHPPEDVCGGCQGTAFDVHESAGEGRVESVAVVHHAVHPLLKEQVPYAVVVVSLDDAPGVHVVGNVVGAARGAVAIGRRVRVAFEAATDPDSGERLLIPQWELLPPEPSPR